MRCVATILALMLILALPAAADTRSELFSTLANAPDEAAARQAETAIWTYWTTAPDADAQALLDQAMDRRRWHDFAGALPHLDRLIEGWPDYAEGWNQRATIRFYREEYALSLDDIEETLKREPAHFGALAGKAVILMRLGRMAEGQLTLIEALQVNPWLRERAMLVPGSDL